MSDVQVEIRGALLEADHKRLNANAVNSNEIVLDLEAKLTKAVAGDEPLPLNKRLLISLIAHNDQIAFVEKQHRLAQCGDEKFANDLLNAYAEHLGIDPNELTKDLPRLKATPIKLDNPTLQEIYGRADGLMDDLLALYNKHSTWGEWKDNFKAYIELISLKNKELAGVVEKEKTDE